MSRGLCGKVSSRPRQTVDEITDILRQVNDATAVPSLPPFKAIDTHDRTVFGDEHLLRLSETLELVGHRSRVHVVGRRERLTVNCRACRDRTCIAL